MFGKALRLYATAVAVLSLGATILVLRVIVFSAVDLNLTLRAILVATMLAFIAFCVSLLGIVWQRDTHGYRVRDLAFQKRPAEREAFAFWYWTQVYVWSLIGGAAGGAVLLVVAHLS